MNTESRRRNATRAGLLVLVLAAAWLLPPAVHKALHYCPVRPDGVGQAQALPAFARKYGVSCSQCHVAFPLLNAYGRQFKMNGYVRERGSDEGVTKSADAELWIEKYFPWAVIMRSRPVDSGKGTISEAGANFPNDGRPGFKMQGIADVDMFFAGGDAARHISAFGEIDMNATGGFVPGGGDFSIGYHPYGPLNVVFGRRGFWAMDPYQTILGNESPTVANRALDGALPDQNGLSGNTLGEQTQTAEVYGYLTKEGLGSVYYAAGATGGGGDDSGRKPKNANFRVALENNKSVMIGGFGSFGHEVPAAIPANGGGANTPEPEAARPSYQVKYAKAGVDALVEVGDFTGRGAFLYSYDAVNDYHIATDPLGLNANGLRRMRDRAAYAELMYSYKRGDKGYPFLLPLIRENWYTTYNNKRQFNYITLHLAHYFAPNVKAFAEYSWDTKADLQGVPPGGPQFRVPRGSRVTGQIEVGF